MIRKKKFITVFLIVFISGLVIGYTAGRFTRHRRRFPHPPSDPQRFKLKVSSKILEHLELTSTQKKQIKPFVDQWFEELYSLRKKESRKIKDIFFSMYDKIEPVLDQEQKKKLDLIRKETIRHLTFNHSFKIPEK